MANEKFTGELGVHYPLHVLNRYSVPELIGLAERAQQSLEKFGFAQIWTNDNLEYRSVVAASAPLAARLPIKLGTAITVPYFRNPIDLAMAFATIARRFDGVILQTLYGIDEMEVSLARLAKARAESPLGEPLRKIMLLNASIARDGAAAKQHAKRFVSHIVSGWPDEVLRANGIDP